MQLDAYGLAPDVHSKLAKAGFRTAGDVKELASKPMELASGETWHYSPPKTDILLCRGWHFG
jgi:hypothetical protein